MPLPDSASSAASTHAAIVIPAYNEADHIAGVLRVLTRVRSVDAIVVVDDGSADGTGEAATAVAGSDPRVRVVRHEQNRGKGQAMHTGLAAAGTPVVLFLDADLHDLQARHVEQLLAPVVTGRADMTIGLFSGGRWNTDLAHRLTPWLSGQRCLRAALWSQVCPAATKGYGVETALSVAARCRHWRTQRVTLDGVHHPPSEFHRGFWRGLRNRARMYGQIVRAAWVSWRWLRAQAADRATADVLE